MANQRRFFVVLIIFALTLVFGVQITAFAEVNNNYQEHNPLVLFEDNTAFWSAGGYGSGNLSASVVASTLTKQTGSSSLQVNVNPGQFLYVEVGHDFHANQNWTAYDNLCFWFYGSNSGNTIQIGLAAPDSNNQYMQIFNDNFTGWAHLIFPLRSFITLGNPAFSTVTEIGFFFFNSPSTFYFDRLILDTTPQTTPTPTSTATTLAPTATLQVTPSPTSFPTAPSPLTTPTETPINTPSVTPTPESTSSQSPSNSNTPSPSSPISPTLMPSPTSTTINLPSADSVSDWVRQNWQWIILFVAIVVVILFQIVVHFLKRKRTLGRKL